MHRRAFLATTALGTAALGFPAVLRAQGTGPIKIGFPLPLTGPFGAIATDQQRGAILAMEQVNARGGLLGRQLEVLFRDDQLKPAVGAQRTKELIENEKVDFIVGGLAAQLRLDPPPALAGGTDLGFMVFPTYRLFILAVTAVALIGLWLFLERTNVGLIVRAGTRDPLMVRALGLRPGPHLVPHLRARRRHGRPGRRPGRAVARGLRGDGLRDDHRVLVVVVVGGMGSLLGAIVAGLLIGEVVSLTTFFAPKASELVIFIVMALVLLVRPSGLFGEPGLAE